MDPFSISASIITVIGAAGTAIRGIEKILAVKDAPHELQDLYNEVSSTYHYPAVLIDAEVDIRGQRAC